MAISLKDQLRIVHEGIHYHGPFINVLLKGRDEPDTLAKSTQLFYDFYAMKTMHNQLGKAKDIKIDTDDPHIQAAIKNGSPYDVLLRIQKTILAKKQGLELSTGLANWEDVDYGPLAIVPHRLREVIDTIYSEVTTKLSEKLQAHLRMGLVQEFRYLTDVGPWTSFRHHLTSIYNQTHNKISDQDFKKAVAMKLPDFMGEEDVVKRVLLFSKYYHPMHPDPADFLENTKTTPQPKRKKAPYPDQQFKFEKPPTKDIDTTSASAPEEPEPLGPPAPDPADTTDYAFHSEEPAPGADWEDDDSPDIQSAAEKAKLINWIKNHERLNEAHGDYPAGYAHGRMSPHTIQDVQKAIKKSGLTWEDIVLAYKNMDWGGGVGGTKWGVGVEGYLQLISHSPHNLEDMAATIDHIYDLQHNTGALLNKGGMYVEQEDLDRRYNIRDVARFLPYVSPLIKGLIIRVLPYITKHPEIEKDIDKLVNSPTKAFTPEQEAVLSNNKCTKGFTQHTFTTDSPFRNKLGINVPRHYTIKAHANGMYSLDDSLKAVVEVFDTFDELEKWLKNNAQFLIKPVSGITSTAPSFPTHIPSPPKPITPTVGAAVTKEYTLSPVENNMLQILASQKNIGVNSNHPNGMLTFVTKDAIGNPYPVLWVGKKALTPTGQAYVVQHAVIGSATEFWNFSNWNQTYGLISKNFDALIQPNTAVKGTLQTATTPSFFQTANTPLPPHAASKASYKMHSGIDKPANHTIRLTQEDENLIKNAGFEPKMAGSDVWYIHDKVKTDIAKFYPNDTAKIMVASGTTVVPVTMKIEPAIAWLVQKYTGATVSPLVAPVVKSTKGSKVGSPFDKILTDAGFNWDDGTGIYRNDVTGDMVKIPASYKPLYTDGATGQTMTLSNLPALAILIKKKK